MASEMRDGILTEESYRNVARCPPMTLNVSVVSCVGRSPRKKARARRPHGRPHGVALNTHKSQRSTETQRDGRLGPFCVSLIGLSAPRGVARHRSSTSIVPYKRCGRVSARSPPPAGAWTLGGGCGAALPHRRRSWPRADRRVDFVSTAIALPALLFLYRTH